MSASGVPPSAELAFRSHARDDRLVAVADRVERAKEPDEQHGEVEGLVTRRERVRARTHTRDARL